LYTKLIDRCDYRVITLRKCYRATIVACYACISIRAVFLEIFMHYKPISKLTLQALWFPIWMVLFELSTYIANDMILPGMLQVVAEFNASVVWVATAMSAYLLGGASLQWFLGPWSDRAGRRPVMLLGVAGFIVITFAICFARSIEQFMLMRVLQGMGMCFVGAVGYAAIQEAFTEKTAIQVTALMINVSMLAPLAGPLAVAALLTYTSWKMIFVVIAAVSLIAGIGLYYTMPETSPKKHASLSLPSLWRGYQEVLKNPAFMLGVIAAAVSWIPLLAWIGQSPVFIMDVAHGTTFEYGLWQIPVMGAVIVGSAILAMLAERVKVHRIITISAWLSLFGLVLSVGLSYLFAQAYQGAAWGLMIYALGLGLGNAALFRIVLFSSKSQIGLASAAYGTITFLLLAGGLESCKFIYELWSMPGFVAANLITGIVYLIFLTAFFKFYTPTDDKVNTQIAAH
jgi:DHA1 family multidrug/chloramphenicol efflux transport protein-like MFS transporter